MAYMDAEIVKNIRSALRKEFKGFKWSVVRGRAYGGVEIHIMQSPLYFPKYYNPKYSGDRSESYLENLKKGYAPVNEFYIDDTWIDPARKFFKRVLQIVEYHAGENKDRNDYSMGGDYSDWNYHIDIIIGKFDKPCVYTGNDAKEAAKQTTSSLRVFASLHTKASILTSCFDKVDDMRDWVVFKGNPDMGEDMELYGIFTDVDTNSVKAKKMKNSGWQFMRTGVFFNEYYWLTDCDSKSVARKGEGFVARCKKGGEKLKAFCDQVQKFVKRYGRVKNFIAFKPDNKGQKYLNF